MKACSKCKENKELNRYTLNDFGTPQSWCKDCLSARALEKYYEKKAAKELSKELVLKNEQQAS
jgi:hypothetical protein